MARTRGIGRRAVALVAGATLPVLLVACGSSAPDVTAGGYLAVTPTQLWYLQLAVNGAKLNGTLDRTDAGDVAQPYRLASQQVAVTGTDHGDQLTIDGGPGLMLSGALVGPSIVLQDAEHHQAVQTISLFPANRGRYEAARQALQARLTAERSASVARQQAQQQQQASEASEASEAQQAIEATSSAVKADVATLAADTHALTAGTTFGPQLDAVVHDLEVQQLDLAAEMTRDKDAVAHNACAAVTAASAVVAGQATRVQADAGAVAGRVGSIEQDIDAVDAGIINLASDHSAFVAAEAADPTGSVAATDPTDTAVTSAMTQAMAQVASSERVVGGAQAEEAAHLSASATSMTEAADLASACVRTAASTTTTIKKPTTTTKKPTTTRPTTAPTTSAPTTAPTTSAPTTAPTTAAPTTAKPTTPVATSAPPTS